jgi:transcriptional regulator with XRE-family HTH domain
MMPNSLQEAALERIAQKIRRERIARNLTLKQVAQEAGIARETLIAVEQGRANPTLKTLAGIAVALDLEDLVSAR